jgi:hypothetical protein
MCPRALKLGNRTMMYEERKHVFFPLSYANKKAMTISTGKKSRTELIKIQYPFSINTK